jgi:hypothetical protein
MVLAANDKGEAESISAVVESGVTSGLIIKRRDRRHFMAAVYDPQEGRIYFKRFTDDPHYNHNYWGYAPEGEVSAPGLCGKIRMEASVSGNDVTFTVSGGTSEYKTQVSAEGITGKGAGLIQFTGIEKGIFTEIRINGEAYSGSWDLYRGHWGRLDRTPIAHRLDGVGFHAADYPSQNYYNIIRWFKEQCKKLGFMIDFYSCNEIYAAAAYPPGPAEGQFRMSDIGEAKYLVGSMAAYAALNIMSGPCHITFTGYPHPQSTCRTTVPNHLLATSQPKPTHYGIRNISNIMAGFYTAGFEVEISDTNGLVWLPIANPETGEKMLLLFLEKETKAYNYEDMAEREIRVAFKGITANEAVGYDAFNGTEQPLDFTAGADTVIEGFLVKDYPVFIKVR